jgi:DNA-binding IclR family transcriptional regulator
VYRLLRTLEAHDLAGRAGSRYVLGFGVAELASRLRPRLQSVVLPILKRLSQRTGSTALLSVADGDQALILLTAEPVDAAMHLALREGARHPLTIGADGVAILAGRPASGADTPEVRLARERGYAVSIGKFQEGAVGVAAPIQVSDWSTASIGVVQLGVSVSGADVPAAVTAAAAEAAKLLSAQHGHTAVGG